MFTRRACFSHYEANMSWVIGKAAVAEPAIAVPEALAQQHQVSLEIDQAPSAALHPPHEMESPDSSGGRFNNGLFCDGGWEPAPSPWGQIRQADLGGCNPLGSGVPGIRHGYLQPVPLAWLRNGRRASSRLKKWPMPVHASAP